jgi:dTMP kinase
MNTKLGKFIVIEGNEGSGKSTQLKKLAQHYGDNILLTREPGGSPFAEVIRDNLLKHSLSGSADVKTMFLGMWASRAEHMQKTVIPALLAGKTVICDRFDSATWAYQIFGQEGSGLRDLFWQIREVVVGEYKPDLYIFLKVDPKVGLQRKGKQVAEINHFEERGSDFQDKVALGISDFLNYVPGVTVDANPALEEVFQNLISVIDRSDM